MRDAVLTRALARMRGPLAVGAPWTYCAMRYDDAGNATAPAAFEVGQGLSLRR
ncbi:hypothetical protein [Streptomyces sp. NPDC051162]|uniref:hypothetical protein n=1 Tax=unclassified Streptomyces TaxID=2593676 RepID=UPI003431243F